MSHDLGQGDQGRGRRDPAALAAHRNAFSLLMQRTEWNVRDSDGTVIFTIAAKLAGGSKRTAEFAKKHGKPWLHISDAGTYERPEERLAAFVRENNIKTLNVAGSRGSKEPKVASFVKQALEEAMVVRGQPSGLIGRNQTYAHH